MPDFESTAKWKVDITQFTKAMQEAKQALQNTNNEFKMTSSTMDRWSNNTSGLEAKLKQLGGQIEAETRILNIYQNALEEAKKEFGEASPEAERLSKKVYDQQIKINKATVEVQKYTEKLNGMQNEQKESESALDKLNSTIEEQQSKVNDLKNAYSSAVIQYGKNSKEAEELKSELQKLSSELADNKRQMQDAERSADELDQSLNDVGDAATDAANGGFTVLKGALANLVSRGISAVANGMKNLARETFDAGSNFESSMSQVAAVSGATGSALDKLTDKAKAMGSTTKFTASEAADAFNYMAMAGWKTEDMLNGIEGIMNLAAASGADLATTSDIVTDALTAMGYSAKDAGKLADVMAAASSNANTNVEMMGQTFQYAAPIIGALGYEMEDAAVAIGLMANAGIKGEKAGTALRSILTRLSAPPKECADAMDELGLSLTDSEGNMKSMDEVIGDLRKAFDGLSETEQTAFAKQIAGQEAMSGLLAVVRAAPSDYEKLTKAVNTSTGAAARMAETMQDNVSGQLTMLKSKIEGIMIKTFEKASKSIKKALETISKALDRVDWDSFADSAGNVAETVANMFAFVIKHGNTIVGILKAIAVAFVTYKAVSIISSVVGAFGTFISAVKTGKTVMEALNMTMTASPVGLIAAGVAALVAVLIHFGKEAEKARQAQYGLNEEQQKAIDEAQLMAEQYEALNKARNDQVSSINAEFGYIQELKDEYNGLIDSNGKVKKGYEDRANFILNQLAKSLGVEVEEIQKVIDQNGKLGDSIDEVIRKKQAEAILMANEQIYNEAITNRADALDKVTKARETLKEAEDKYAETQAEVNDVMEEYNRLLKISADDAVDYYNANFGVIQANDIAKKSFEEAQKGVEEAEGAWIGYNSTIKNYEGLSAAIISGDVDKINEAMQNMTYNFITAETGNRESLERQVENYQTNLDNLKQAIKDGTPSVTQEMVDQAQAMVDAANAELDKLPPEASNKGAKAGSNFATELGAKKGAVLGSAKGLAENAEIGINPAIDKLKTAGDKSGKGFGDAVGSTANKKEAKSAGEELADEAVKGASSENGEEGGATKSGSNFGEGFFNGIGSWVTSVWQKAKELAKSAWNGLKKGQEEGSPSKLTTRSGKFFGEGYAIGIDSMVASVRSSASHLAKEAVDALGHNMNTKMLEIGKESGQSLIDGMKDVMPNVSDSIGDLKASVASANGALVQSGQRIDVGTFRDEGQKSQTVVFNQTINSPKAVDRLTLYRETNSMLFSAKVRLGNV